ncbi:Protein YIP5 AltName: Full=YPT-interacting protein 5 [Cyberlindnera jadinii]|uniref:Protein YIP n=1 Tax=Cyberlindnera jadinii (strain ATCC 18201 / CBS 1600 / BCRC 20928 / JCM 3617 / NBRC 0987 / NRRL Y-1542) TaxID=983966 RepID=A0A0H5C3X6_CYBJN|nr:Protein YIP5 AltName: Full=YPT-interacting protein 5 [Cyberlindnera jadinii]
MSKANENNDLLDIDNDNWLEDDTNLSTTPKAMTTQAYIPPDDFVIEPEVPSAPQQLPGQSSDSPHISNNFDGGVLSVNHYRRYFNLNTTEFLQNCAQALNFVSTKTDSVEEIGDLYGPIWVTATVIFILFFSNTCSGLLVSWVQGGDSTYKYNFDLLTGAISLLYGYTFLIPTIFYFITVWYLKLTGLFPLSRLISIYGYANIAWVPAAILSILRGFLVNHTILSSALKWISVLFGGVISCASILVKVFPVTRHSCVVVDKEKLAIVLCAALLVAHVGLIIAVKVSFFGDLSVV